MAYLNIYPNTYKTTDELFQYLGTLGYRGTINDRMYQHLVAQGYFGALADMVAQAPLSVGPADTATLAELLPVSGDRTKRQGMVDNHFPPSPAADFEGDYTGISDTTGYTVVTCTSAGGLATQMNNATASQKLILECAWNGNSTATQRMLGYTNTTLTVDGAVDWGYVRPVGAIVIRPAAGYSPIYESSYSSGVIEMLGFSRLHIEDMVFENPVMKFGYTSTYPCWGMVAIKNCTFQNGTNSDNGAIALSGLRVLHATGNDFVDCDAGFIGGPNYFRSWDNTFKGLADNDVHGVRGAPHPTHTTHVWVAGTIVYDMSARKPASGLHCDFLQISHPADSHVGYSVLAEMNMAHLDRGGTMYATQLFFGGDGNGFIGDWLIHNNIGLISAYWAARVFDPDDDQDKVITKNIFLRAATPNATQDAYTRVRGLKVATGTGTLTVRDNIAASFETGNVTGESFSSNVIADPRTSASSPNRYVDKITGNGTWGTDANGRLNFTSPDAGAASSTAAKDALTSFTKPIAGWSGSAPEDPDAWPTGDYANLT